jgi:hypothetical protein
VTFRLDGKASFRGDRDVSPLGAQTGVMPRAEFDRLVALAAKARFFELQSAYDPAVTDLPYCYTRITRGPETKMVATRCAALPSGSRAPGNPAVPSGLLRLEEAIDSVRQRLSWKQVEAKPK